MFTKFYQYAEELKLLAMLLSDIKQLSHVTNVFSYVKASSHPSQVVLLHVGHFTDISSPFFQYIISNWHWFEHHQFSAAILYSVVSFTTAARRKNTKNDCDFFIHKLTFLFITAGKPAVIFESWWLKPSKKIFPKAFCFYIIFFRWIFIIGLYRSSLFFRCGFREFNFQSPFQFARVFFYWFHVSFKSHKPQNFNLGRSIQRKFINALIWESRFLFDRKVFTIHSPII